MFQLSEYRNIKCDGSHGKKISSENIRWEFPAIMRLAIMLMSLPVCLPERKGGDCDEQKLMSELSGYKQ